MFGWFPSHHRVLRTNINPRRFLCSLCPIVEWKYFWFSVKKGNLIIQQIAASTALLHSVAGENIYKVLDHKIYLCSSLEKISSKLFLQKKYLITSYWNNSLGALNLMWAMSYFVICQFKHNARCQWSTVSGWSMARWQRLVRRLGWKQFAGGTKPAAWTRMIQGKCRWQSFQLHLKHTTQVCGHTTQHGLW